MTKTNAPVDGGQAFVPCKNQGFCHQGLVPAAGNGGNIIGFRNEEGHYLINLLPEVALKPGCSANRFGQ